MHRSFAIFKCGRKTEKGMRKHFGAWFIWDKNGKNFIKKQCF